MLYVIDAVAVVVFFVGFHVAFRQNALHALGARLQRIQGKTASQNAVSEDPEGVASVFRMIGVMMMAFSFTAAAFANLIAHFASSGGD
jgi:hypothetical protein